MHDLGPAQPSRSTDEVPNGAMLLLFIFLVVLVLAWSFVYLQLWQRG